MRSRSLRLLVNRRGIPPPTGAGSHRTLRNLWGYFFTTVLIDRLNLHCNIVETGNDSWRFKSRAIKQSVLVSAIPASSDEPSATTKPRSCPRPDSYRECRSA
jgi:hypothetical protein